MRAPERTRLVTANAGPPDPPLGVVCLVIARGVNSVERDIPGAEVLSGTKKEVKRVARGMNPITRGTSHLRPITCLPISVPPRLFFCLSPFLLFFSTFRLPSSSRCSSLARGSERANAGQRPRVHTASFSDPFERSSFFLLSFVFLAFFLQPVPRRGPLSARLLSSFASGRSRFSCILTRLHARGFAVRPD